MEMSTETKNVTIKPVNPVPKDPFNILIGALRRGNSPYKFITYTTALELAREMAYHHPSLQQFRIKIFEQLLYDLFTNPP